MAQDMMAKEGGAPGGAPQGGPDEAMAVFGNVMKVFEQLAPAIESAPPEIQEKFQTAVAAYQDFLGAFTGGGGGQANRMPPEQAAGAVPVR